MIPRYLFHYTSIETAKKIFLSHKFRFTRLDLLNDPYEGDFLFPEIPLSQNEKRKVIYCSCWSDEQAESVNLWYIYTNMRGVRLKMKASMFSKNLTLQEQPSGFAPFGIINPMSVEPHEVWGQQIKRVCGPLKVTYVDSFEETFSTALGKSTSNAGTDKEFEMYDINLQELGIKKVKHWAYEGEWRYKVSPFIEIHGSKSVMEQPMIFETPRYIDIPFVEEIEEILLAPSVSEEEYEDLNQFIKSNHISVAINRSQILYRSKDT